MKIFKGILGLLEIILIIFTIVAVWNINTTIGIIWIVYLSIAVLCAIYETGKEQGSKHE